MTSPTPQFVFGDEEGAATTPMLQRSKSNVGSQQQPQSLVGVKSFVRVRPFTERQLAAAGLDGEAPLQACLYTRSDTEIIVDQHRTNPSLALPTDRNISRDVSFSFHKILWSLPNTATIQLQQQQPQQRAVVDSGTPEAAATTTTAAASTAADSTVTVDVRHPADVLQPNSVSHLPLATQDDVFQEVGAPMVASVMRGVNACVIAFGQTGSGKTYTTFGSAHEPGLAPRLAHELFVALKQRNRELSREGLGGDSETDKDPSSNNPFFSRCVEVGCFEIYNEKIIDLLAVRSTMEQQQQQGGKGTSTTSFPQQRGTTRSNSSAKLMGSPAPPYSSSQAPSESPTVSPRHVQRMFSWPAFPTNNNLDTLVEDILSDNEVDDDDDDEDDEREAGISNYLFDSNCPSRQSPTVSPEVAVSDRTRTPIPTPQSSLQPGTPIPAHYQHHQQQHLHQQQQQHASQHRLLPASSFLRIRHDPSQGGSYIEGLRKELVEDSTSLIYVIQQALQYRMTSANSMHHRSSRSHAIMQITVTQNDRLSGTRLQATAFLVDLAGSERGAKGGATGASLQESKKINLSLTTLRRVIDIIVEKSVSGSMGGAAAGGGGGSRSLHRRQSSFSHFSLGSETPPEHKPLSRRASTGGLLSPTASAAASAAAETPDKHGGGGGFTHIPLRDSKLTEVLVDCFGGNSTTFMIATVSPHEENILETLDSLRYCHKAKHVVNRVRPNDERISVAVVAIQQEIERLKRLIQETEKHWKLVQDKLQAQIAQVTGKLDDGLALLPSRRVVSEALRAQLEERVQELEVLNRELQERLHIASERDAIGKEIHEVNLEIERIRSGILQAREDAKRFVAETASELLELQELQSIPFPATLQQYLAVRKRHWRSAFIFAAKQYAQQRELEDARTRNQQLRNYAERCEAEIALLEQQNIECLEPHMDLFHAFTVRSRDVASVLARTVEHHHKSASALRDEIEKLHWELVNANVTVDELAQQVTEQENQSLQTVRLSANIMSAVEREMEALQQEETTITEHLLVAEQRSIARHSKKIEGFVERTIPMLENALSMEQLVAEELQGKIDALQEENELYRLEREAMEAELAAVEAELIHSATELRQQDDTSSTYGRMLHGVEHSTRKLVFPDAAEEIPDNPLVSAMMSVERSSRAAVQCRNASLEPSGPRSASRDARNGRAPLCLGVTPLRDWKGTSRTGSVTSSRTPSAAPPPLGASPLPHRPLAL
jgi:hypothetical protein